MGLKYAYICNKCNTNEVQNNDNLPSGWIKLNFELSGTRTRYITLHICPTCQVDLSIPTETPLPDKTPEEQLLELIQDIAGA